MNTAEKMLERLQRDFPELGIPERSVAVRTYASASNRNVGALSWVLLGPDGGELKIGSRHTMREILRAGELDVSVEDSLGFHRDHVINVVGHGV